MASSVAVAWPYLALDLALNRKVAIKTMLPELVQREGMVQRFKREAQTAASLNHAHIVQIYTVRQTPTLCYFVMKFVEGRSLESVIHDKGHVPIPMTQTILSQVGSALDFAHRKKVIHRDIKPANIMIDEDGCAIVTDFGIAKVQEAQNLTATGTAIGTPHYMSPEQFHNQAVTGASDQYSLGVVLYEMLAGRKPFDGGSYAEIITQHLFEPVPDLRIVNPEVPEHIIEVVRRMMAKEPHDRFPNLDAAIHALGTPASKTEGEAVRTQMISLALGGPPRKVRMSVPMSPIPLTRTPSPAVRPQPLGIPVSQAAVPPVSAPVALPPAPPARRTGLIAGVTIGVAALAAVGVYLGAGKRSADVTPAAPPAVPSQDSAAVPAAALPQLPAATPNTAPPVPTRTAAELRADSLREMNARLAERRRDSIRLANSIRAAYLDSVRRANASRKAVADAEPPRATVAAPPPRTPTAAATSQTATIKIASPTPNAALYINGVIENLISSAREVTIPAGVPVRLSIRAAGCTGWDTTITVDPGSKNSIGRRRPTC